MREGYLHVHVVSCPPMSVPLLPRPSSSPTLCTLPATTTNAIVASMRLAVHKPFVLGGIGPQTWPLNQADPSVVVMCTSCLRHSWHVPPRKPTYRAHLLWSDSLSIFPGLSRFPRLSYWRGATDTRTLHSRHGRIHRTIGCPFPFVVQFPC